MYDRARMDALEVPRRGACRRDHAVSRQDGRSDAADSADASCICRAVVGRHEEPAWEFVTRLNEVRNRMAHHLDTGDLDQLVGSVVEKLGRERDRRSAAPRRLW